MRLVVGANCTMGRRAHLERFGGWQDAAGSIPVAERTASLERRLIPGSDAELIENGALLALRPEDVDTLVAMVGVLHFPAMLHHGDTDVAVDEIHHGHDAGPPHVGRAVEPLARGQVAGARVG